MKSSLPILLLALLTGAAPAQAQSSASPAEAMLRAGYLKVTEAAPGVEVDLMYCRADNFTGRILYDNLHDAYLHPLAAKALARAAHILAEEHPALRLKVYDAARPMSIQQKMWDAVKGTGKSIYVSNPANGGGLHNYGMAVDVTLCNQQGDTLPMGTPIDYLGEYAHIDREEELLEEGVLSPQALQNRRLLRDVMQRAGFSALRSEWWHFNRIGRKEAKAKYRPIP